MNETMYYLNDHMYYLERIVDLIKICSSIVYQGAWTYTWKWHIQLKAQIEYNFHKKPGKLESEN